MFRSARLKLTLLYSAGIAIIMALFSVALYLALQQALSGNLEAEGNAAARLQQSILASELARARISLVAVNIAGWVLSGAISYVIAGRTLRPIAAAMEQQREFTAHASHELRSPLTVMKGEIGVTLGRDRSVDEYRRTLGLVTSEIDHLDELVSHLLIISRIEQGESQIEATPRLLAETVQRSVDRYAARASARGIAIAVKVPPEMEATWDWQRIERLLDNLVDNAVQHTPESGEITIDAEQRGRVIEVRVRNTGSHLAPEDIPHLFVPFYRGQGVSRDSGTGLGLTICQRVAHAHGGEIQAHNVSNGVSFTVRLPQDSSHPSHHG